MPLQVSEALDPEGSWRGALCPVDNAASIVGSRPALLIVREAFYGTTRFDDFVSHTKLTTAVVSARLKSLVREAVLARSPYQETGKRTRDEYVLTIRGRALLPVVLALMQWGSDQLLDGGVVSANDSSTGARVTIRPVGSNGAPITLEQIVVAPNLDRSDDQPLATDPHGG